VERGADNARAVVVAAVVVLPYEQNTIHSYEMTWGFH
jgi:hypothetical protein